MGFLKWLRERTGYPGKSSHTESHSEVRISYEGGNGDSVEAAIVVRGARFDLEGTYAEFAWLTQKYGQKDKDWKLLTHSHGKHGTRDIDTFEIQLADGTPVTVFFDCTESF